MAVLSMFGYSVLIFFTVYFITVFVGMFCGTTGVQFVMTGVVLFIVPATMACVLLLMDEHMVYLDISWYLENIILYTSPIIRLFWLYDLPLGVIEIILYALSALVFAVLALLVYLRRGNENAGNPIVFSRAATFLKFIIMIPTTIAMGVWFGEMGGGLWQIFGFIAGAVLTFMLINAVFTKNARAIFKGVRGLIVFLVIFGVCFVALVFDVLKYDEYIPGDNLVSRVQISINNDNYGTYRDKAIWKSLKTDLKRYMNNRDSGSLEYPYDGIGYVTVDKDIYDPKAAEIKYDLVCPDAVSVHVVYYTKLGMPIVKYLPNIPKADFKSTLKAIADSDEFEKYFYDMLFYSGGNTYEDLNLPKFNDLISYEYKYSGLKAEGLLDKYKLDMGDISYESFQYPEVGDIYKRVRDGHNYHNTRHNFPVFMNCDDFFDTLLAGEDVVEQYIGVIHSINVYLVTDEKAGEMSAKRMTLTDRADIKSVLLSIANATDNHPSNVFCEYDYRYLVEIRYFKDAINENKDRTEYVFDDNWIGAVSYFIGGKVPAFVENGLK